MACPRSSLVLRHGASLEILGKINTLLLLRTVAQITLRPLNKLQCSKGTNILKTNPELKWSPTQNSKDLTGTRPIWDIPYLTDFYLYLNLITVKVIIKILKNQSANSLRKKNPGIMIQKASFLPWLNFCGHLSDFLISL